MPKYDKISGNCVRFVIILLLGLIFAGFLSLNSVYAQIDTSCPSCVQILPEEIQDYKELFPLTIWTEFQTFDRDSIILVNGHLRPENNVSPVTVTVTNPIGNIVAVDQITPGPTGDFSFRLNTSGPTWKQDGDYIIKVSAGTSSRIFKTMVTLTSDELGSRASCNVNEITIYASNGGRYCIPYESQNGLLEKKTGTLNVDSKTLSVNIRGDDVDNIVLDIPRFLIDSKSESGEDSAFVVMASGEMIDYEELQSNQDFRQIKIDYSETQNGTFQIVGTTVIPEFGTVAMIILIISISAILLVGRSFSHKIVKL